MMSPRTIRAHFDGQHIRLDEPCQLEPDAQLLIVVLPKQSDDGEREDWTRLSQRGLEQAYAEDEPEYSLDVIKKPNLEGRNRGGVMERMSDTKPSVPLMAALKMFELGKLSSGKAAELAGMSRVEFFEACSLYHVSIFNYTDDEIEAELASDLDTIDKICNQAQRRAGE